MKNIFSFQDILAIISNPLTELTIKREIVVKPMNTSVNLFIFQDE